MGSESAIKATIFALLAAGCVAPEPEHISIQIDPSACEAPSGGPVFDGALWAIGESTAPLRCPIPVQMGDTLTEWVVFVQRDSPQAQPSTTARLQHLETVSGLHGDVGPAVTDGTAAGPYVPIGANIPSTSVTDDDTFSLLITGGGVPGDRVGPSIVYGLRP
jgi:hypothetical protein